MKLRIALCLVLLTTFSYGLDKPKARPSKEVTQTKAAAPEVKKEEAKAPDAKPTEPKKEPTAQESAELLAAQKDAVISQLKVQNLQLQYQVVDLQKKLIEAQSPNASAEATTAYQQMLKKSDDIKKAHGWKDDMQFNINTGTFNPTPAPPPGATPAPEPKKP